MIEIAEELFKKHVRPFTYDKLKLHNSSKPKVYETQEEFISVYYEFIESEYEDYLPRGFIDKNFVIHLDPSDDGWYIPVMAYFQPYAFFLEKSQLGQILHKSNEKIDFVNDNRYSYLDGISRWVEIKTIDSVQNINKKLMDIKEELLKDVKSRSSYPAFQICFDLWDEAHKANLSNLVGIKDPEPCEIIAATILASSRISMTEQKLYGNFNEAF
ncbi:MAG: hypothetical protein QW279_15100, partial [Candidatus Jordarchaeaceae archaeon]